MHHQSYWKGIGIFSLALLIGTFASEYFEAKNKSKNVQIFQEMNCVFVDEKLKYQTLTLNEEIYSAERIIKPNSLVVPKGIKVEKKSEVIETLPEMNEKIPRSENRLDLKKQEEYSTLLHKELCYESNGRK